MDRAAIEYESGMDIVFDEDVGSFLKHARPWLLANEATNNVVFAICRDIEKGRYSECTPLFVRVTDKSEIVTAAIQTPPYPFLLTPCSNHSAWPLLTGALATRGIDVPEILGPADEAERFAESWAQETGVGYTPVRAYRIFELTKVRSPKPVPGRMQTAADAHRQTVRRWTAAFQQDVNPDGLIPLERMLADAERRIDNGDCYLWFLDEEPVSMACLTGRTPHGRRVSYVYTPEDLRTQGFAGALVATLSQKVLKEGYEFCFLGTDLANPVSNRLYEKIGYRPVCDCKQFRFHG